MKITTTLSTYLAKKYVINLCVLLCALLAVIYLFDTVELIRRAGNRDNVSMLVILQMGLFKLPEVGQTLFPFGVLFSAMFTFWQLTRRYELIVVRASGFSIWQFLTPIIAVGIMFGVLQMTVINPVGAVLISKFEDLERNYLSNQKNQIAVFKEGLWLKQNIMIENDANSKKNNNEKKLISGYAILHAKNIKHPEWILNNVTVLYFTEENDFLQRVDAHKAQLDNNQWNLENATIHKSSGPSTHQDFYTLPTTLTVQEIEESFSSPESMSFWKLPAYIQTLESTGFDATRLKVFYQSLLSQPLMFCAMILLAATVSMRPPRSKGTFSMIATGVFIGFIIFFMSSFLQALGATQQIPVILAAWSPALISFLLGLSVIMNVEDG
jgi:lipopolysaccharide export system permease protein